MSKNADVVVVTDVPDAVETSRRLSNAERKVLLAYESKMLKATKDAWTGWEYKGRPEDAPRLVSHDAWRSETVSTKGNASIVIYNDAKSWNTGKSYVEYVHRVGQKGTPEWERVADLLEKTYADALVQDLAEAMADELTKPGPSRKLGGKGGGNTVVLDLELK